MSITDQFGTARLDVVKPVRLLVPSALSVGSAPAGELLDHFTCYRVVRSRNAPRFARRGDVQVTTSLATATVDVLKPLRLCVPTDTDSQQPGAQTGQDLLLCYSVRGGGGLSTSVGVENELGPQSYLIGRDHDLCVPSHID